MMQAAPLAPLVVFAYNRPHHLLECLKSLSECELASSSDLIVFSDGPKREGDRVAVERVRSVLKTVRGFKSLKVIERPNNFGLATSVITGVDEVLKVNGFAIIVEDDLILSPIFIKYMNDALKFYKDDPRIFCVTAFNFRPKIFPIPESYRSDVIFAKRPASTGFGTWRDRWEAVDWEVKDYQELLVSPDKIKVFEEAGKDSLWMLKKQMNGELDSWAIRWSYHHAKNNGYCVYPRVSLLDNIGWDGSGVHCRPDFSGRYKNDLSIALKSYRLEAFSGKPDPLVQRSFEKIFKKDLFYYSKRAVEILKTKWILLTTPKKHYASHR